MNTAKGVSRISGLAVAVGLGVAVAGTPGVALAEPDDSSASNESSSSSAPSDPSADSMSDVDSESSGTSSPTTGAVSSDSSAPPVVVRSSNGAHTSASAGDTDVTTESVPADEGDTEAAEVSTAPTPTEVLDESQPLTADPETETAEASVETESAEVVMADEQEEAVPAAPRRDSTVSEASSSSVAGPAPTSVPDESDQVSTDRVVTAAVETETDVEVEGAGNPVSLAASPFAQERLTVVAPQPVTAPANAVTGVVSGLLAWAGLSPSLTDAPAAPVQPTALWAVLAWVRREIEHTFFNQTPTIGYNPAENSQTMHVVSGDLHATDADGDPLSFTVTDAPESGTVVINPDGTFAYTPSAELAETGGTDEFTVKVSDAGLHLHGLFGFFQPDQGHSATATIAVTVAANQPPQVGAQPFTIDHIDPVTGVITGSVHITDPDGDPLTYALNSDPAYGTVVVDPQTGQWTYTPTQAARLLAALHTDIQPDAMAAIDTGEFVTLAAADPDRIDSFDVVALDGFDFKGAIARAMIGYVDISPAEYILEKTIDVGINPHGLALDPGHDRLYVANFGSGTVSVIDTNHNELFHTIPDVGAGPSGVVVSPDGTHVYVTVHEDGTVRVIDASPLTLSGLPIDVGVTADDVAISPDGRYLYVAIRAGTLSVVDTLTRDTIEIDLGYLLGGVAVDGSTVYVGAATAPTGLPEDWGYVISVVVGGTRVDSISVDEMDVNPSPVPFRLAVSPDDDRLYVATFDNTYGRGSVWVIDTLHRTVVGDPIRVGANAKDVAVSPDGSLVYVTSSGVGGHGGKVSVIDTETNRIIATMDAPYGVHDPSELVVSPDGTRIYLTNFAGVFEPGTVSVIGFTPA